MSNHNRRTFLANAFAGMTAGTLASLVLAENVSATASSGTKEGYEAIFDETSHSSLSSGKILQATLSDIEGPFYRKGVPYRGKTNPPLSGGVPVLISGRVWSLQSRKPLAGTVIDVWHADHQGNYDNSDANNPPAKDFFAFRSRLLTDESGYYEYEAIHPGGYTIGRNDRRPSHIHYWIRAQRHKELITQLYFEGDPENEHDRFIKKSLIIPVKKMAVGNAHYEKGTFDIVLNAT